MAAKKKMRVVHVKPPPPVFSPADAPDARSVYVKLPLPPEVIEAAHEHYASAVKLWGMFERLAEVPAGELVDTIRAAATAVHRDVKRVQRARRRR